MILIKDLGVIKHKNTKHRRGIYECPMCFKEFETNTNAVKTGTSTKCSSCSSRIINTKHAKSKTRLYTIWSDMKARCVNKKLEIYKNYGERGIGICDDWRYSFINFHKWALYNGYEERLTIDRVDNNGNYEPDNCRWVERNIQTRNTRVLRSTNTSGYRGVSRLGKKWLSQIRVNYKIFKLGYWNTPLEAAKAYDYYVILNNLEHTINNVLEPDETIDIESAMPRKPRLSKGISFHKRRYVARKTINKKTINIGSFDTETEAIIAYNEFCRSIL